MQTAQKKWMDIIRSDVINLRKKFKSEDSIERQKILKKYENGELTV